MQMTQNDSSVLCWFDYSSPFAYLGTTQIERVAKAHGANVVFQPFLLGALFREIGTPNVPLAAMPAAKAKLVRLDLDRYAELYGVPFRFSTRFPLRTVTALRVTLLAPSASVPRLVHEIMKRTWTADEDPSDVDVLRAACVSSAVDASLVDRADDARDALLTATNRAVAIGLCGAPTFQIGEDLYWGQDRLDLVSRALARTRRDARKQTES